MSTLELLRSDGSITVNKALIHAVGLNEAILFCELLSRYNYFEEREQLDEDGYFFNTQNDLRAGTGLGEKPQKLAISHLKSQKLIDYKLKGLPAKRYFKIIATDAQLLKLISTGKSKMKLLKPLALNKILPLGETRSSEMEKQDPTFGRINNTNLNNTNPTILNNENDNGSISENRNVTLPLKISHSLSISEDCRKIVKYYFEVYERNFSCPHPNIKPQQMARVCSEIQDIINEYDLDIDSLVDIVDRHFERDYKTMDIDYNINHFATRTILRNIMFEVAY